MFFQVLNLYFKMSIFLLQFKYFVTATIINFLYKVYNSWHYFTI